LFSGQVDDFTRRRKSFFSNTLVLPGFDAVEAAKIDDPKKLDSVKQTLILRGRHLESADFYKADLRKADLEGAQLQDAILSSVQLQGASLKSTQLQGAGLFYAELQGALLEQAQLQGALLEQAQLQGASLNNAQLMGAVLNLAQLQGTSLENAQLQGALLDGARLQGASLYGARLQGASLDRAQLQSAHFQGSALAGTNISGAAVWRTSFEDASLTAVFEDDVQERAISKVEFATLQVAIREYVPGGQSHDSDVREDALKRIEKLNPDESRPMASARETLEKARVDKTAYESALADQLKSLACSGNDSTSYIVRGLIANGRIKETGPQSPGLVEAILDPKCPVSAALTDADKAALKKLAEEAQAPAGGN
jgi:uncharacterized protein YjbI with pentapeptide repeats